MYTKANLAALRVKKDIAELSQHRLNATHASTSIDFPDGTRNLLKLKVGVSMTAGLFEGTTFYFILTIPPSYPFHAPTVVCTTRAWHPNIDLHTGLVSLPILSHDWRPVLSINTVVFALQLMFIEPTEHYPVNEPAAAALKNNPDLFREQVRLSLSGGCLFGVQFESHRHGAGGGKGGGPGVAQKRKRGFGESMDTEAAAVQTTLEAMRIQGDESATVTSPSAWDKRPRHQQQEQAAFLSSLGQQRQQQQQQQQQQRHDAVTPQPPPQNGLRLATFGEPNALGAEAAVGVGLPQQHQRQFQHQHQQQRQQQQQHAAAFGSTAGISSNSYIGGGTAFDRLRCHAIEEAQRSAAAASAAAAAAAATAAPAASQATTPAVGLRCGGDVGQSVIGVPQPPVGVVGEGVGTTGAWGGGGQFQVQAVPASRLH
ncbi:unnamed protein product [Pylaiella littoralis]